MSTSGLGTLLASRLDAVLGVPQAQQGVKLDGRAGHAVSQPAQHIHGQDTAIRRNTEDVGARTAGEATGRQVQARGNLGEAAKALAGNTANNPLASARTQLSEPAQTILALLLGQLPNRGALQGFRPLLFLPMPQAGGQAGGQGAAAGAGGAAGQPGAGATAGQGGAAGAAGPGNAGGAAAGAANAAAGGTAGTGAGAAAGSAARGASAGSAAATTGGAATGTGLAGNTGATSTTSLLGPLPPGPTGLAPAMASALQQTVVQSGLFYESHLAQMAFGQRGPGQLAREPQAHLPQPGSGASGPGANAGAGPTATAASNAAQAALAGQAGAAAGGAASASAAAQAAAAASAGGAFAAGGLGMAASTAATTPLVNTAMAQALAGIHPDAAPLVRQQLETLANQAFAWQGEAWQGAPMRWEIQRRQPGEESHEALATWATRLKLQLPRLGNIEARLSLAGDRLVMRLVAPQSAPLLQGYLDVLRDRLVTQGLQLTDTAILAADPGATAATAVPPGMADPLAEAYAPAEPRFTKPQA